MRGLGDVVLASPPPPRQNQLEVFNINGNAGERGITPYTQQVRQAVSPVGRPTVGAQNGNVSYSSQLRSGNRHHPSVRPVGQSPRELHRWTMNSTASLCGGVRGGVCPVQQPGCSDRSLDYPIFTAG